MLITRSKAISTNYNLRKNHLSKEVITYPMKCRNAKLLHRKTKPFDRIREIMSHIEIS